MKREYPHERLKRLRLARGMSLQQFADAVDLSKTYIWELEKTPRGLEHVTYTTLCGIAAALGLSVTALMSEH